MPSLLNPSGRTAVGISPEESLHRVWRFYRDQGFGSIEATEKMGDFARRLDDEREAMAVIRKCLERKR